MVRAVLGLPLPEHGPRALAPLTATLMDPQANLMDLQADLTALAVTTQMRMGRVATNTIGMTSHTAGLKQRRNGRMIKAIYTLADEALRVLDVKALTTLEAAEQIRDDMEKMLGKTYHVVNLQTLNSKD